jgi:hypothetical protein
MIPSRIDRGAALKPLRFAVTPEPGESLPGLLARATRLNVLESMSLPLENAGIRTPRPGRIPLLGETIANPLAAILGCDREDILCRLTPYLESSLRGDVRFGDAVLSRKDLRFDRRRISPLTLSQQYWHRSDWLVALLPFCPVSGERLRDDCSECGGALGWAKSWGLCVCEHCEEIVKPSSQPMLPSALMDYYRHFCDLISADRTTRNSALAGLPKRIRNLEPKSLLDLCFRLGTACRDEPIPYRRNEISNLPTEFLASVLTRGVQLLRSWPDDLQRWSRDRAAEVAGDATSRDGLRLRLRGLAGLKHPDQADVVRKALPHLFLSRLRSFAAPGEIMLTYETFSRLGIDSRELRSLEAAGILRPLETLGERRRRLQFPTRQVNDLASRLRGSSPAASLAWRLGLPIYAIEQLCGEGFVAPELHPGVIHLRGALQIVRTSAEEFERRLRATTQDEPPPPEAMSLAAASRRIGGRLKPWSAIVAGLLSRDIPCWRRSNDRWCRSVTVRSDDLATFETVMAESAPNVPAADTISKNDAEELLNCTIIGLRAAEDARLLRFRPSGKGLVTERAAVLDLAVRAISCAEVALRSGNSPRRAAAQMRRLRIPPIAFGWDRSTAEQLLLN